MLISLLPVSLGGVCDPCSLAGGFRLFPSLLRSYDFVASCNASSGLNCMIYCVILLKAWFNSAFAVYSVMFSIMFIIQRLLFISYSVIVISDLNFLFSPP